MPDLPLPKSAFIDPTGANRADVEALFAQTTAVLLDFLTSAAQYSPLPKVTTMLPVTLPENPLAESALLSFVQTLLRSSMNPAHPGYIGHMDSLPTVVSILGDLLAAGMNNNMLSVEMSPMLSQLEPQLLAQIAQLFGLGDRSGGLLVSGGSLANLQALAVARNVKLQVLKQGLSQRSQPPVLFASELAHTSIQKAAMILGLGTEAVIPVATNANAQMSLESLQAEIEQAIAAGQQPFAIVATAGTTVTGNIDPLPQIAAIAQQHQLWLHVDAAYGGALIFSPEHRHRLSGIEQADSVTFNPQKWLYVAKTCVMVLFRQFGLLQSHFKVAAPYMAEDSQWPNLGELSVQGTRHADILKLWLSLQHIGKQGYAKIIQQNYQITTYLVEQLKQQTYLQFASQPEMNIVCFRGIPDWIDEADWDAWNTHLQQHLLREFDLFVSLPSYRGQRWLKVVLLNPYTDESVIDQLCKGIATFARGT
ncbi:MAG: aspartate aminotransferase family protein [Leptolyngbyaceae cyanobacterium SM1_1_3]|nr:aspartate aminotransferase family protein [Leptolyngbyaceae cyanobacterium SM1_1_3]NJN04201.1 aspartate aminotransferase family protein [Leptolyngbyaceae cyanobacterium RM1_1_2]